MSFKTADLCDEFERSLWMAEPLFHDYGGAASFGLAGPGPMYPAVVSSRSPLPEGR
jgi:hypothetical protein